MSYLTIYYGLEDALIRLFLWRGGKKLLGVKFPITSLIAFLSFINIVEKPDLIPTLFFASIGW